MRVLGFNLFNRNRAKQHLICIQQVPGRSKVTQGRPLERRGALWVLFRIQNVNHRQQCLLMGLIFISLFKTLSVKTCCHCLLFAVWFAVCCLFLVQHTSATLYAMRPLQCKSPFFECVALFLDSNWNFMMST